MRPPTTRSSSIAPVDAHTLESASNSNFNRNRLDSFVLTSVNIIVFAAVASRLPSELRKSFFILPSFCPRVDYSLDELLSQDGHSDFFHFLVRTRPFERRPWASLVMQN